jgi:cephalosporin hydroxylase
MANPIEEFFQDCRNEISAMGEDTAIQKEGLDFITNAEKHKYSYHFTWMGRPIIQYPQDMVAMQELIWKVQPDLIIETGVAHGGSLIYYASILELIGKGEVLGIDIDIREHNRAEIEKHPMFKRIKLLQGSSISDEVMQEVKKISAGKKSVMVSLDSNHTHDHVLAELKLYAPFVTKDSYLIAFDTVVEDMPENFFTDRPWGKGDNPKTAVHEFLKSNNDFIIDSSIQHKLLITVAPDGYLKRVK